MLTYKLINTLKFTRLVVMSDRTAAKASNRTRELLTRYDKAVAYLISRSERV